MASSGKNPSQLTDDDREVIDQVVVICVAIMYFITTKYTAKQLGEIYILSFSSDQVNGYLGSSHMTENLRLLEALGAYQNITNKKQIKHQDKGVVRDDRGGKPSRYRITTKVQNIKNLMNKPEACDLLRNRLFKLKIFYEYQKLVITGLFYAAKKNKTIIKNLCRVFLPLGFENIVETFINKLSSINEDEFLNNVARATQICIDYQKSDIWFILKLFFPFL